MKNLLFITIFMVGANAYTFDYSGMKCETKKYCKEMTSCKEAYFYLEKCGVYRLDRDKDGIPCEKICGN